MSTEFRAWPLRRLFLLAAILLLPATRAEADGAFAVDSAEFSAPGNCKLEGWTSFGSNDDFIAALAPACAVKIGIPVELSGQLQRARADGEWGTGASAKAKINLIPVANHPFGLGLAGGGSWDLITGENTSGFIYLPATVALHENFRINLNAGWLHDVPNRIDYLTWGAGFEWNFAREFTLIGEVFGQTGSLPPVDVDEPASPNSLRQPRLQVGLRYTPRDNIDFDLIWGHNIAGENAHWITTGVNFRF